MNKKEIIQILKTSSGKRITTNYISLLLIQATNLLLPIITFPYLIRVVGKEKFGVVMFAQSICLLLYVFVDYGFSLSATRRISILKEKKDEINKTFSSVLFTKACLAIVIFLLYAIIIDQVPRFSDDKEVFLWSYLIIVGQAIFPDWFFQGIEKMKLMAVISFLAKALFTILIFIFILVKEDYIYIPIFQGIGYVLAALLSILISLKYVKLVMPSFSLIKELLLESFSLFASNLAARVINNISIVLLGFLFNDTLVGIYSSMEKLITTTKGVFVSLYQALFPWLANQNNKTQRAYIGKIIYVVGILALVMMLPFLLFGTSILELLYDDPAISDQSYILKILSSSLFFSAFFMLFVMHYFPAIGDFISRLKIISYAAIIGIITGVVLIQKFDILGAAITAIFTEFSLMILSIYYYRKQKTVI